MSLKELSLVDLSSLRILIVTNSAVQKLVLKNLTGLENLDLSSLTNLTSVRFEGDFTALKSVTFANKEVWEKVEQHSCTWNESITFKCLDSEVEFVGP